MLNTIKGTKGADLLSKLSTEITVFAIISGLVIRKSKSFKPEVFLLALIKAAHQGKASFNKIAIELDDLNKSCAISSQALWKRLTREGCMLESFIGKCMALISSHGVVEVKRHKKKFNRVLTEDSSFVKMIKLCSDLFPASGNKHGSTAGLKVNLIFDLLTGAVIELSTHAATYQDRNIAWDILDLLKKGDLVLRDMGYFNVAIFKLIEDKCADWLSRIPISVNVYTPSGESLESLLGKAKSNIVDRQVEMTEDRHTSRLIAVRKSKKEAAEARRNLKAAAKKAGKTVSKKTLTRAEWYLLATSIPKEKMSARDLGKLYAQRWQIEIVFKAWKQSNNLEKSLSNKSNYQHILGIFLAEVLVLALTMYHYAHLRRKGGETSNRISIGKLGQWVSSKIGSSKKIDRLLREKPTLRLITTEKRERKFQLISMLEVLG